MNRTRVALVAATLGVLGLIGGFWTVSTTASEPDKLIVPGKQLGVVRIGETPEEVGRLLGAPLHKGSAAAAGTTDYVYNHADACSIDDVEFTAPPGVQVLAVSTVSPACMTAKSIRVGSSGLQVINAYAKGGPGYVETRLPDGSVRVWYKNLGIVFVISPRDTVIKLQVRKSGY